MRILIIPDSFKECLKANEVCRSIHKGISDVIPKARVVKIPFSDGGEGALDFFLFHTFVDMAGIAGAKTLDGSAFMTEPMFVNFGLG